MTEQQTVEQRAQDEAYDADVMAKGVHLVQHPHYEDTFFLSIPVEHEEYRYSSYVKRAGGYGGSHVRISRSEAKRLMEQLQAFLS